MINYKEISTSDYWEMFARDFLQKLGFQIESPPDRGPDGGKDILAIEEIQGALYKGRMRWLVSCKHFANSGNSVSERDEPNILERLASFKAQGFIGFYSTIPSSSLNARLRQLKENNKIREYRIFDNKLIENYLITPGFSRLMFRYFPESYKKIKPLHLITSNYEALKCDYCGKDLLMSLFQEEYASLIAFVEKYNSEKNVSYIKDIYCACKGECDRTLRFDAQSKGYITMWADISDLVIPIEFLRFIFGRMEGLRNGSEVYSDVAYKKLIKIIITLAQKVLRFTTEEERQRVIELLELGF